MGSSRECIPVIDLEQFSSPRDHQELREICKEWGCFRVVNHEVPLTLMSDMMKVARSMVSLPLEIKQRIKKVVGCNNIGYHSLGKPNTYYEALRIYDVGLHSQSLKDFCSCLDASPLQSKILEEYGDAILQLAKTIGTKLVESLEMDGNYLEGWPLVLKINGHHMTPDITSGNVAGPLVVHSDPVFLTIFQDDEINSGGFEVMDKSGALIQISSSAESLIVLLGDIGRAWSNGRFLNVKHRASTKEGMTTTRVSLTAFLYPPREETIDAPSKLVNLEYPRLYVPFIFQEFHSSLSLKGMTGTQGLELLRARPEETNESKS